MWLALSDYLIRPTITATTTSHATSISHAIESATVELFAGTKDNKKGQRGPSNDFDVGYLIFAVWSSFIKIGGPIETNWRGLGAGSRADELRIAEMCTKFRVLSHFLN